jgi:radical SAM protein with 4Fe4S-binding SPASM domain
MDTGLFARWGRTEEDDPSYSPFGPEILDIEVSTICHGPGAPCKWCYKSNTSKGENMSFETFRQIFDRITNRNLTQIAFGIGDIDSNPDLYEMFAYARGNQVIPNVTINGWRMNEYHFNMLSRLTGAVAVSHYDDNHCFDAVKELTDRGMEQVNIHKLLSNETLESCHQLIDKATIDPRLKKLNAIVFLLLKPKGNRNDLTSVQSLEEYRNLFLHAQEAGVQFGMDSCSGPNLLKATEGRDLFNIESVEPCESTLFSLYINTSGEVFPCSFTEGQPGWEKGITVLDEDSFLGGVWFSDRLTEWRKKLLGSTASCKGCQFQKGCRSCPEYDITICNRR